MRVSNDLTGADAICVHPDNLKDEIREYGSTVHTPTLISKPSLIDTSASHAAMTYNKQGVKTQDPSFVDSIAVYQLRQSQRQYVIDEAGYIDVKMQKYTHQPCFTIPGNNGVRSCITALTLCQLSPLIAYSTYSEDNSTLTIAALPRQRYTNCIEPYWFFWSKTHIKKEQTASRFWHCRIPGKVLKTVQAGYGKFLCLTEDNKIHTVRFDRKELVCDLINELPIKFTYIAFDKRNHNIALLDDKGDAFVLKGNTLFEEDYRLDKAIYNQTLFEKPAILNTQHLISEKSEFNNPQNNRSDNFTEEVKLLDQRLYYHDGVIDIWNRMGSYFDVEAFVPGFISTSTKKREERGQEDTDTTQNDDVAHDDGDDNNIENQTEKPKKYTPFGYIVKQYAISSDQISTHK